MATQWYFGPFRLDRQDSSLWQHTERLTLRPKTFDVLVFLVERAGQLVTKEALLEAVWPHTTVGDGVLKTSLGELRKILGETPKNVQFIATVHGRGYRFIAPVTTHTPMPSGLDELSAVAPLPAVATPVLELIERGLEWQQAQQCLAAAQQGQRQMVFVTGEAGIGKTTFLRAFMQSVPHTQEVWVGHGQCIEQYGTGEPYLPLLDALGQLLRGPEGPYLFEQLQQHAPSWLLQLPALIPEPVLPRLQQRASGTTPERMLREFAEAVETLTVTHTLVLILEDLHWSDVSTLEWLAYVARRRQPARLLVIAAYRPVEAVLRDHPVRTVMHELRLHGLCTEVSLPYFSAAGVATYLAQRFAPATLPPALVQSLHQRTNGNPLFVTMMAEALVQQNVLCLGPAGWEYKSTVDMTAMSMPEGLRQLITQYLEQLTPAEQEVLEVASVVGREFPTVAVAAGLACEVETVELYCTALARRGQLVRACGLTTWPDGTVAARFAFIHDLYREFAYERTAVSRRVRWHQHIGLCLEQGYGARAGEIAAELAMHFWHGRDTARAVQYARQAAENAMRRHAAREAITHLTTALELVHMWPDSLERSAQELTLRLLLGPALIRSKGYSAPEVGESYQRARVLCQHAGETPHLFPVLCGLALFHHQRAEWAAAREIGQQLLGLAEKPPQELVRLVIAHYMLGAPLFWLGELVKARQHFESALGLYNPQEHRAQALLYGDDPGIACRVYLLRVLWMLGYTDQALERSRETLALSDAYASPFSRALACVGAAFIAQFCGDAATAEHWAQASLAVCMDHHIPFVQAWARALYGAALAAQGRAVEGIAEAQASVAEHAALGASLGRPYLLMLLARAYGHAGRPAEALTALQEAQALAAHNGEGAYQAELYRLQGELLLQQHTHSLDTTAAEACWLQALAVAQQQDAKALELRVALHLSELWRQQGKEPAAYALLAPVYQWFSEGFETADMQRAAAFLRL